MDFVRDVLKALAIGGVIGLMVSAVLQSLSEPIVCADCGAAIQ